MPGPAPTPSAIKRLRGGPDRTAGGVKYNDAEPQPALGQPDMPKGLSSLAKREWKRVVPLLLAINVLTVVDGPVLMAYCESWAMWVTALKEIKRGGLTYESGGQLVDGKLVGAIRRLNPAVAERDKALKSLRGFMNDLGLSPSARTRIKTDPAPKRGDPFEEFLKEGQAKLNPTFVL